MQKILCEKFKNLKVGEIVEFFEKEIPPCFLTCSGQILRTEKYIELFDAITYNYGGTTGLFKLPKIKNHIIKYTKYKNID